MPDPPDRVLPTDLHDRIVIASFAARGFTLDECRSAADCCRSASWHGVRTHNALKALHLDEHLGSGAPTPGCVPGASIVQHDSRFAACQQWDAQRKLGQAVADEAITTCERLADTYGVGIVSVDHAFHYLWGGGYVMASAQRGYIAYTHCTAALAEAVPFGGKRPTLGTNPHSFAFPTTDAVGFPITIDWATSVVAMGRVQQLKREGKPLPPNAAVDDQGNPTTDPHAVAALLPFGAHKGYGLSLINELSAAYIGGSLPTLRSRPDHAPPGEKTTPNFFFQVIHPDAISCGHFAAKRDRAANVQAVLDDILAGNPGAMLPGQLEHAAAQRSARNQGLVFTHAELTELHTLATQHHLAFDPNTLPTAVA